MKMMYLWESHPIRGQLIPVVHFALRHATNACSLFQPRLYLQSVGHARPALATTRTSKSWSVFRMCPGINITLKIIGRTFTIFTITLALHKMDAILDAYRGWHSSYACSHYTDRFCGSNSNDWSLQRLSQVTPFWILTEQTLLRMVNHILHCHIRKMWRYALSTHEYQDNTNTVSTSFRNECSFTQNDMQRVSQR